MRAKVGAAVLVLLIALTVVSPSVTSAASATYTDPQNRFSLLVPDGYHRTDVARPPIVIAFTEDVPMTPGISFTGGYNVIIEDVTPDIGPNGTLDDIAMPLLAVDAQIPGYQPVSQGVQPTTLGGRDARAYEFSGTLVGIPFHIRQCLTSTRTARDDN